MPIILIIGGIIIALGVGVLVFMSPNDSSPDATPQAEVNVRAEEVEGLNDMNMPNDDEEDMPNDTEANVFTGGEMPATATAPVTPTESASSDSHTTTTTYLTPARTEHLIEVTLTLAGGVVSDATVTFDSKPLGQYSNDNQARFADAYKTEVIGKPLADISLARVGGASLTSHAFNEAVAKIAAEVVDAAL